MWSLDPRSLPTKVPLMTQRVYAIYAKNKLILWGLITYLGLGIILTGYLMARMKAQEGSGTGLDLAASESCLIYVSAYSAHRGCTVCRILLTDVDPLVVLSLAWIAPMAFDLVVFTLTAYKTFGSVRRPDMPLSHLLIRDGESLLPIKFATTDVVVSAALYFGIMVVLNAADVATYYVRAVFSLRESNQGRGLRTKQPYLRGVLGPLVNSVSVALISRMMLNLHAEAHATLEPPSLQLDTLAFASQEGRSSPNDHPSAVL
ncbi:hypothetical protein K525DRAFT_291650 [Schizophyllum commune Loenen D]|nr:hypothetical protein K525DRAFT_291650 [Schizophyllum commune Loenen D]